MFCFEILYLSLWMADKSRFSYGGSSLDTIALRLTLPRPAPGCRRQPRPSSSPRTLPSRCHRHRHRRAKPGGATAAAASLGWCAADGGGIHPGCSSPAVQRRAAARFRRSAAAAGGGGGGGEGGSNLGPDGLGWISSRSTFPASSQLRHHPRILPGSSRCTRASGASVPDMVVVVVSSIGGGRPALCG
jgi:hypothetical protein